METDSLMCIYIVVILIGTRKPFVYFYSLKAVESNYILHACRPVVLNLFKIMDHLQFLKIFAKHNRKIKQYTYFFILFNILKMTYIIVYISVNSKK